jgi:hypothetical protein
VLRALLLAIAPAIALPALAALPGPAELPPPEYAGQQYVDSKGCLFVRGGQSTEQSPEQSPGQTVWVPRVTRDGKPMCDNPPSGQRVPAVKG